jgi:hypothetical protein
MMLIPVPEASGVARPRPRSVDDPDLLRVDVAMLGRCASPTDLAELLFVPSSTEVLELGLEIPDLTL